MNVVTAFLVSLLAIPVMRIFNNLDVMSNGLTIFLSSSLVLAFVALIVYVNRRLSPSASNAVSDKFIYVFTVFAFTSVVDLFIGLELHGYVDEFMAFYLREGEPYLYTSHGMIINYWDGTGHYLLYLWLLYCLVNRVCYRYAGLYWVGSIMNSMVVLLGGGLIGKFGHKVKPSFFLNTPYVLCPLLFGFRILTSHRHASSPASSFRKRSALMVVCDALLAVGMLFLVFIFVLRGVAASGSPSYYFQLYGTEYEPYLHDATKFGTIQALLYLFYYVPLGVAIVYALRVPGCQWLPDVACLVAGGVTQGQLSHVVSSLAQRTSPASRVPDAALPVFWLVNLAVFVVPQLLFLRALVWPRFFLAEKVKK